jgi:hydrogenase maturation protease
LVKPSLVIGLGNPLVSGEGIGPRVARLLTGDADFAARAEIVHGGTDLFRYMELMQARERVVLIDVAEGGEHGDVSVWNEPPPDPAHEFGCELSSVKSLQLLRIVAPQLDAVRFTWVLVHICAAGPGSAPASGVEAAVRRAAEAVRRLLA